MEIDKEESQTTSSKYLITIDKKDFLNSTEKTIPDEYRPKSLIVLGNWAAIYEPEMDKKENTEIKLKAVRARINHLRKRSDAAYFRGNAKCKGCTVSYSFALNELIESDDPFVEIEVYRFGEHHHDPNNQPAKKPQIKCTVRSSFPKEPTIESLASSPTVKIPTTVKKVNQPNNNDVKIRRNSDNLPNISQVSLEKIVSEFINKDMMPSNWISNIESVSDMARKTINGKKISGYTQQFSLMPEFILSLHTEIQLKTLHQIPFNRRILHVDSADNLCYISKYMREYNKRIVNFMMLVTDLLNNEKTGILVNETVTSGQDLLTISQMFRTFKYNYMRLYPDERNVFRLIIIDLSWSSIRAALETFNLEDVSSYSKRMFELSQKENIDESDESTYIVSCANHTIKSFINQLKRKIKFNDKISQKFSICCFNLLLNATSLSSFEKNFRLTLHVYVSQYKTNDCLSSIETLKKIIECRPKFNDEIDKIIRENFYQASNKSTDSLSDDIDLFYDDDDDSSRDIFDEPEPSIKNQSQFTCYFNEIYRNLKKSQTDDFILEENPFYNPEFVELLLNNFIPYAFIWAGFSYRCLISNDPITKMTNEPIEHFIQMRKSLIETSLLPASYITRTVDLALNQCRNEIRNNDNVSDIESIESSEDDDDLINTSQLKWNKRSRKSIASYYPKTQNSNNLTIFKLKPIQISKKSKLQ